MTVEFYYYCTPTIGARGLSRSRSCFYSLSRGRGMIRPDHAVREVGSGKDEKICSENYSKPDTVVLMCKKLVLLVVLFKGTLINYAMQKVTTFNSYHKWYH